MVWLIKNVVKPLEMIPLAHRRSDRVASRVSLEYHASENTLKMEKVSCYCQNPPKPSTFCFVSRPSAIELWQHTAHGFCSTSRGDFIYFFKFQFTRHFAAHFAAQSGLYKLIFPGTLSGKMSSRMTRKIQVDKRNESYSLSTTQSIYYMIP